MTVDVSRDAGHSSVLRVLRRTHVAACAWWDNNHSENSHNRHEAESEAARAAVAELIEAATYYAEKHSGGWQNYDQAAEARNRLLAAIRAAKGEAE